MTSISAFPRITIFSALLAVAVSSPGCEDNEESPDPAPILEAREIPRYQAPLVVPPLMPPTADSTTLREYRIAARQFTQQILPPGLPPTTVWGYGRAGDPLPGEAAESTFHSPAFTIEARVGQRVRVEWVNGLMDAAGRYLPHLLPIDQTLHWANPPGPPDHMTMDPAPYLGPVPLVTHVHGARVPDHSDGHPEAWYLAAAADIPAGFARQGTRYGGAAAAAAGSAVFEYPNEQRAGTLWYHDHSLGITRANVYAGLAGFFLLRGNEEDGLDLPGPGPGLGDAPGTRYYDLPIVIQDRTFRTDGSLFYPGSRAYFDDFEGPYVPDSDVPPIWNPEFFGNAMMVNGRTWPYLEVEPRRYRIRWLNGCNSRFLILRPDREGLTFTQIGTEGGLLPDAPVVQEELLLGPAERADVILDFSGLAVGEEVVLLNLGPDEPFKGFRGHEVPPPADPETTGQVMKFVVVPATGEGNPGTVPESLPALQRLATALPDRDLTLNELVYEPADVPRAALLGTVADGPLAWMDAVTETPRLGDTEVWRFVNLTMDAHPIHLHLVMFQVVERQAFDAEAFGQAQDAYREGEGPLPVVDAFLTGAPMAPEAWETGYKDTVIAYPGEVTRVIAHFDLAGQYLWHCHILEHEDNEMMRPFHVVE